MSPFSLVRRQMFIERKRLVKSATVFQQITEFSKQENEYSP